jgi:hypothetical protein
MTIISVPINLSNVDVINTIFDNGNIIIHVKSTEEGPQIRLAKCNRTHGKENQTFLHAQLIGATRANDSTYNSDYCEDLLTKIIFATTMIEKYGDITFKRSLDLLKIMKKIVIAISLCP